MTARNAAGAGTEPKKIRIRVLENLWPKRVGRQRQGPWGFVTLRELPETHLVTIWPGYTHLFGNIRDIKEPVTQEKFDELVTEHGYPPYDFWPDD